MPSHITSTSQTTNTQSRFTAGISTPVERLVMYDAAISQVFMLCSHVAMGYDGLPSASSEAANGATEDDQGMTVVRVRVYWCK